MNIDDLKFEVVCLLLLFMGWLKYGSYIKKYITWNKICLGLIILTIYCWVRWFPDIDNKIPIAILTILFYFINNRINELVQATGIVNAVLHKYLTYHPEYENNPLGRVRFSIKYQEEIEQLRRDEKFIGINQINQYIQEASLKLIEKLIHHNELVEFLHKIQIFHCNHYRAAYTRKEIKAINDNIINTLGNSQYKSMLGFTTDTEVNNYINKQKNKLENHQKNLETDLNSLKTKLEFVNFSEFSSAKLKRSWYLFLELCKSF